MKLSFLFLFNFLISSLAYGAACCGGSFAAPAIITGDDKAQFTSSLSYSEVVVANVNSSGVWSQWDENQKVQTFRMEGAHIISDRWQAGISVPVIQRSRLGQTYSGLGDVSTNLAYEYLTNWNYNPYRPKGIGYLQLSLPTGKSKAESEVGGVDSRGNGFWALGAGTILTKTFGRWDGFTNLEIHRSFDKEISGSQMQGTVKPGYGGSFGLGAGYNTALWRFGSSLTWNYEDPIDIEGSLSVKGSIERYATATASASYMIDSELAGTLSYSDQTLIGAPVNTSLARTVSLLVQKRWLR